MDVLDRKTDNELLQSMIAELAKAKNEINTAQRDLQKADSRIRFLLVLAHKLMDRQGD
jgi:hypothetical protein